jgi:hypothetical protein
MIFEVAAYWNDKSAGKIGIMPADWRIDSSAGGYIYES